MVNFYKLTIEKKKTLQLKNLATLLTLKVGDQVRVKEGKERTAVFLDWKTVDNWWDGVIREIYLPETDVIERQRGSDDIRVIPAGTPQFRIAPRGPKIRLSYLDTPGYKDDVKHGRDLSYWNKEKRRIFQRGFWVYPEDGDKIVKDKFTDGEKK